MLRLILDDLNRRWDASTSFFGELIDTNRYDIIEKPEWKKKRLEGEAAASKERIEYYQKQLKEEEEHLKKTEESLVQLK